MIIQILSLITLHTCQLFQMGQSMLQRCTGLKEVLSRVILKDPVAQAKGNFAITCMRSCFSSCREGRHKKSTEL